MRYINKVKIFYKLYLKELHKEFPEYNIVKTCIVSNKDNILVTILSIIFQNFCNHNQWQVE